jgi:phosphoribosyl 1,2-cyclic phosphodiesterase
MLSVQILGSGSSGNSLVVSCGDCRVLVDAGLSYRDLGRRMAQAGLDPSSIQAVFLSHEHDDHVKGLRQFLKHHPVPLFASPECLGAYTLHGVKVHGAEPLYPGQQVILGSLSLTPFLVPHDAATYGFVYECGGVRVGHATDLGQPTEPVADHLAGCHCLLLEFNHDVDRLSQSDYPAHLKIRIRGSLGHLSNEQGAQILRRALCGETSAVYLMHLSRTNNSELLARMAASEVLTGRPVRLEVAQPHEPTAAWTA